MAMTQSNSMSVKPGKRLEEEICDMQAKVGTKTLESVVRSGIHDLSQGKSKRFGFTALATICRNNLLLTV